jgi:hypothetical protein
MMLAGLEYTSKASCSIRESRRSQQPAFLPNKSACQGRACGAPRSGFTLDKLICSEVFAAVAIDGGTHPRIRHCERSEAIQCGAAVLDCFVASLLAMTS